MRPVLVVMAAGLGSRYGGLKQIDKIGPNGEIILELSCYDAIKVGFKDIVFILRKEIAEDFKELIGNRISNYANVSYVYQDINNIPEGCEIPEGRKKPWGTAHALLCTKDIVKAPFVAINADDYYGKEAFKLMYEFLFNNKEENCHGMIGYKLCNTLSENGHVARGICTALDGKLVDVVERTKIIKRGDSAFFTEDDTTWQQLDYNGIVSMNMWGFMPSIFNEIETGFKMFFENDVKVNPLKSEFYIPLVVNGLLTNSNGNVKVMETKEKWYGVTYQEDKKVVREAINEMIERGVYSKNLWEEK